MAATNGWKSGQRHTAFKALGAVIVATIVWMAGLSRLADRLEPQTGDIIAFPATRVPSISTASFAVSRTVRSGGVACTLDVPTMRKSGGSIVVESVQLEPGRLYQVHWAGVRTSNGRDDCGGSADLLLNSNQISALIFAAGGTGAKARN